MPSEAETLANFKGLRNIYIRIKKTLEQVKFNSISDCISTTKLICEIIYNNLHNSGLAVECIKLMERFEGTNKYPMEAVLAAALINIEGFLKTGSEKVENDIKELLDGISETTEYIFENSNSFANIIRNDGNSVIINEYIYKTSLEINFYIYNSINLLYINAKLCREKMKQFSQMEKKI